MLHSGLIPKIAVLSEPGTSSPTFPDNPDPPTSAVSSESIITVEQFLRRGVQTPRRTKQAVSSNVSLKKSRAYTHHRPPERRTACARQVTKVVKQPREPSRIAKALFRAAILTDGDPLDTLVDGAGVTHTRRPLKFVPVNKFSTPCRPSQAQSFEPSNVGRVDGPVHTRRLGNTSGFKQHHHSRAPLYMVPLQEAEVAYSAMFP